MEQAAAENGVSERVTTAQLDWSAEEGVPEGAPFELVLAADPNPNPNPNPKPKPKPKPNPNQNSPASKRAAARAAPKPEAVRWLSPQAASCARCSAR